MGLEYVELIMDIEDKLEIQIKNEEAQNIKTAGQFYELIRHKYNNLSRQTYDDKSIWILLTQLIARIADIEPEEITPETRFIEDLDFG